MPALDSALRRNLENTIISARDSAERAAGAAIKALAVGEKEPYASLSPDERRLRNRLRAKARQLGGGSLEAGLDSLVAECAYEQWHRMLFARFLAENALLMHPEGVPVTLEECAELAQGEGDPDAWATAARYASLMLPGIFGGEEPTLEVRLAPEGRRALERLLKEIPPPTFTSDDGLGWVYQFWQTKAKKEVNQSGRKIGDADLPAVTQLFTEDYMVKFLLHNTLGAWWAARHPDSPINANLDYLRRREDGTPAAGTFSGWPEMVAKLEIMDPCCGSGHFLTAAAELLCWMRMEEEGLSEADAAVAVLRDNIFGLELDTRCTQIAAFSLAFQAWRHGGYRELPVPHVACSGIPAGGREEEWTHLARGDYRAENTLSRLHSLFKNAPDLGSLIDPSRVSAGQELHAAGFEEAEHLLEKALVSQRDGDDPTAAVFGEAARGIVRASALLKRRYHLVVTNVPFLGQVRHNESLKAYAAQFFPRGKSDLALVFLEKCRSMCRFGGYYALILPQGWLAGTRQLDIRRAMLEEQEWKVLVRLGSNAFELNVGAQVMMGIFCNAAPDDQSTIFALDPSMKTSIHEKKREIEAGIAELVTQLSQLENYKSQFTFSDIAVSTKLGDHASMLRGLSTGEIKRFERRFWELESVSNGWERFHETAGYQAPYCGRGAVILWENEQGDMASMATRLKHLNHAIQSWRRGKPFWGKSGVAINLMGDLFHTIYTGNIFSEVIGVIMPKDPAHLTAIWAYFDNHDYVTDLRKIYQKRGVEPRYLASLPFDLEHWQKVADEQYPDGLPEPYSDDPTQWLFHGHPAPSTAPLQVAAARMLGYRWPAEIDETVLSTAALEWISRCGELEHLTDPDGIVCLPAVAGEQPAAERLRRHLAEAYGGEWSPELLDRLLAGADHGGKDLNTWLRDRFFAQHCRLFHNRPFIWHVWDGRKDGFSALVNYHRLDGPKLRRLIYTYLGSYIEAQSTAARSDVTGADLRLAAAQDLKSKLEAILHGEDPYDIYVRWKRLDEQPIGWEPDLNDGMRLNIRPFVTAGVLRSKFTINWNKDRGKNPDGSERHNDLHFTRADKEEARKTVKAVL